MLKLSWKRPTFRSLWWAPSFIVNLVFTVFPRVNNVNKYAGEFDMTEWNVGNMCKCVVDLVLNTGSVMVVLEVLWWSVEFLQSALICTGWFPSVNALLVNRQNWLGLKICPVGSLPPHSQHLPIIKKNHYHQSVHSCLCGLILGNGANCVMWPHDSYLTQCWT